MMPKQTSIIIVIGFLLDISTITTQGTNTCLSDPDLQKLNNLLDQYHRQYESLQANMTANQNAPRNDITKTITNQNGSLFSAWVDLFQLHSNVAELFTGYTNWLRSGSGEFTPVAESTSLGNKSDMQFLCFKIWLKVQDLEGNITKLEEYQKHLQGIDEEKAPISNDGIQDLDRRLSILTERVNLLTISRGSDSQVTKTVKDTSTQNSATYDKKAELSELETEKLQGQVVHLNTTVMSLMEQLSRVVVELARTKTTNGQAIQLGYDFYEPITNVTCNGNRRHLVGSSCYYIPKLFDSEKMYTWWDARYFCKRADVLGPEADLVVIETRQEMDAIRHMITNHFGGIEGLWLGASDIDQEGHWIWAPTGAPLSRAATYWAETPQKDTLLNCASMEEGFQWLAEPCYYERVPLCEIQL